MSILIDTGVFYALYDGKDEHHLDSLGLFYHILKGKWGRPFTSNYVVLESTLLLNSRLGRDVAQAFPKFVKDAGIEECIVDEEIEAEAVELFVQSDRLSLTDSATLVFAERFMIKNAATYDRRSFAGLPLNIVGARYWEGLDERERSNAKQASRLG